MAKKENSVSNASSPIENKRKDASTREGTFTVAQLGPLELRHAIVSPDEDTYSFDNLSSRSNEAQPMRQYCSSDATLSQPQHADEEFHVVDQLYTEPPLQHLPPQPLPTIPSTAPGQRVDFSPNNVDPGYLRDSVPAPSPLFGPPITSAKAAASLYMPFSTAPASVQTANGVSRIIDVENGRASRGVASSMLEKNPANTEETEYGLDEAGMAQVIRDQGHANGEPISCKCGNRESWQSNLVECMGPRHRGGRWFHWECARLTMETVPEHDWYCTECTFGDNDTNSGDEDFPAPNRRPKRPQRTGLTDSTIHVSKKPCGSKVPASSFETFVSNTPNTPKSRGPQPSGRQARKTASSRKSRTTGGGIGAGWTAFEQAMAARVMTAMMQENHKSLGKEERWEEAARRLQLLNVNRTAAGMKNHWNREGRAASGIDERRPPNPRKMKTGLQAASKVTALRESRKLARAAAKERKRKAAEERREEERVRKALIVTNDDEDEDDVPHLIRDRGDDMGADDVFPSAPEEGRVKQQEE